MFCVNIGSFPENERVISQILNAQRELFYKAFIHLEHKNDDTNGFYAKTKSQWKFVNSNPLSESLPEAMNANGRLVTHLLGTLPYQFGHNFSLEQWRVELKLILNKWLISDLRLLLRLPPQLSPCRKTS
ncbi:hypothetical protein L596_015724 [Steinernema carpocapsae]|uniref:Uncharacterized protein n=1 Tax=Steinernema carpocapsae TaxID=34508 RepID=A0A4U5NFT8_STECR|nr:hypothetical protein L596_015724 [Steinernema carpocapsae]